MADKLIVNRGLEHIIKNKEKQSGSLWITEDGQNLYVDSKDGNNRIQITDVIDLKIKDPKKYYPNKLYVADRQIKRYNQMTGKLEVISDLDNDVINLKEKEFEYASNDLTMATIQDSSNPRKGTIVIDKNGTAGIVTSSTTNQLTVTIISDSTFLNVLSGYDIYFDSNNRGKQIGTFNHPFNNWDDLYDKCKNILTDVTISVTIHLSANSQLEVSNKFSNLNKIVFTSEDNFASIQFSNNVEIANNENLVFKNIKLHRASTNNSSVVFKNCNYITFNNNNFKYGIALDNCDNVIISNIMDMKHITLVNKTRNVKIKNVNSDVDILCANITGTNSILNSYIASVKVEKNDDELSNCGNVEVLNTTIKDLINVKECETFSLNGCNILNHNGSSTCTIHADNINVGIVNFNGVNPELRGKVNITSGISSDWVFDARTDRFYGDYYGSIENKTLRAHLDAIGNMFEIIQNEINKNKEDIQNILSKL